MLAAITPRTRLIFVCNPNNPTGTVVGAAELERFVAAVPARRARRDRRGLRALRPHGVLRRRDPHQGAGIELFHRHPHVAVLHTFSKAYGLAGLRIGYALAPIEVAENQRKVAVPFGVTDLAQTAALASLDSERELAVRIDEVVQQRDRLHALLIAAGWPAVASQANFVWVPAAERTDELETLLREGGVITRAFPGDGVRISSGSADDVDRVAAALAASARTFHASAPEEAVV